MMPLNKPTEDQTSSSPETLQMRYLLSALTPALKTSKNIVLLKTYFLIPQPVVRLFVLTLLTRITGRADASFPTDDLSEAKFLLTQYNHLPNVAVRDKISALVRQVCVVNGGDIGDVYKAIK